MSMNEEGDTILLPFSFIKFFLRIGLAREAQHSLSNYLIEKRIRIGMNTANIFTGDQAIIFKIKSPNSFA